MPRADQPQPDPTLDSQPETKPVLSESEASAHSTAGAAHIGSTAQSGKKKGDFEFPPIPGFELVGKLGGGGMGVVFEVIDTKTRHPYALKVIRPDRADADFRARFLKEATTLLEIEHPHIVRTYRFEVFDGKPYYTMKLLKGGALSKRTEQFKDRPLEVVSLMANIADAVGFLHTKGILHRDLKPGNILFDLDGTPRITDFGLVKRSTEVESSASDSETAYYVAASPAGVTTVGQVFGTASYMPPEQSAGRNDLVNASSDVWALGIILYELLTGETPGEDALRGETPPSVRTVKPGLDESLDEIVQRCLIRDRAGRYQTANELAAALRAWMGRSEREEADRLARLEIKKRRRRLIIGIVAAACVLLLAIAVAVPIYRHFNDPERPVYESQRRLKDGQPVQLIPERGLALFAKARTGDEASIRLEKDGTMTVLTQKLALIELLPDPMIDRYRFKVQVRLNTTTTRASRAGIYCLHNEHKRPDNALHSFVELSVCDNDEDEKAVWEFKGPAEGRHVTTAVLWLRIGGEAPASKYHPGGQTAYETDELKGKPGPWHEVEIEVTPEQVVAKHEGKQIGLVKNDAVNRRLNSLLQGPGNLALLPLASPRGGLGLYSMGSTASYRLGAIEPLP